MIMPLRDGSASRARMIDGECYSFVNLRSGKVWKATKEQRIPREKINITVVWERLKDGLGVYAQEECSIPPAMGKYIPVRCVGQGF